MKLINRYLSAILVIILLPLFIIYWLAVLIEYTQMRINTLKKYLNQLNK